MPYPITVAKLRQPAQHEIELTRAKGRHQDVIRRLFDFDHQVGTVLAQAGNRLGQQARRTGQKGADGDLANRSIAEICHFLFGFADLGQDQSGMGGQMRAKGGGHHATIGAFEQQDTHLRLGILQSLGHGGLGHVQRRRGPQQIAFGHDGGDQAQVADGQAVGNMGHRISVVEYQIGMISLALMSGKAVYGANLPQNGACMAMTAPLTRDDLIALDATDPLARFRRGVRPAARARSIWMATRWARCRTGWWPG